MADQCEALVLVKDDRWGGITNQCEREAGHDTLDGHWVTLTACEPVAVMKWFGTYEEVPR